MNRKKLNLTLLGLFIFFAYTNVYAACNAVFTQEAAEFIGELVDIMRTAVPILLLLFGSFDMASVVFSQDPDAIKKSGNRLLKRFIGALLVFFVPLIIKVLLEMPAVNNALNLVDDPLCGIDATVPYDEAGDK